MLLLISIKMVIDKLDLIRRYVVLIDYETGNVLERSTVKFFKTVLELKIIIEKWAAQGDLRHHIVKIKNDSIRNEGMGYRHPFPFDPARRSVCRRYIINSENHIE
jgi:hypothetical protein